MTALYLRNPPSLVLTPGSHLQAIRSSTAQVQESVSLSIDIQNTISQQLSIVIDGQASLNKTPQLAMLEGRHAESNQVDHSSVVHPCTEDFENVGILSEGARKSPYDAVSPSINTISRQVDSQVPKRCAAWCSCVCHVRRCFRSPWVLETPIGRLNVSYSGPWLECNERKCRRTSTRILAISHHFPTYLMNRYITSTMRYAPLDGLTFTIRAPRVTDWSHLYWNYAKNRDLTAIQRMYSQKKASPYDQNLRGSNALMYAANHTDCKISEFLIKEGADPNLPNETGHVATDIMWEGAFANRFGDESTSIVGSILKDTDYLQTCGFSTLHKIVLRISRGDLRSELVISTASIDQGDARKHTPLSWAVIRDDFEAVQALLVFGADPDRADHLGRPPLHFARSPGVCKALLNAGAKATLRNFHYQRSALHCCCYTSASLEVVDLLIGTGIPVDVRDTDDETPLLNAVFCHQTATAQRLIGHGADVNATNISSRHSTIHFAVGYDHHEIIPLLLAKGVHYISIDSNGKNIAHLAASSSGTKTMEVLEKANLAGLDFSLRDRNGETPADIMARREIFADSEVGVHAAFEAFMRSATLVNS